MHRTAPCTHISKRRLDTHEILPRALDMPKAQRRARVYRGSQTSRQGREYDVCAMDMCLVQTKIWLGLIHHGVYMAFSVSCRGSRDIFPRMPVAPCHYIPRQTLRLGVKRHVPLALREIPFGTRGV